MLDRVGTFVGDDGVRLWFECTGAGSGVPLVLCHGGPGMWDYLGPLAALLDQTRVVVRWDQRGCGRSEGHDGPFSIGQSVADLDALRRHLSVDRWVVGGHSWGASLALHAVLVAPSYAAGLLYMSGTGLGRDWHPYYKAAPAKRLTPSQLVRLAELDANPDRTDDESVEWRTLHWLPDFADGEHAAELAAINAYAPWPVNLECNSMINAETKTLDPAELRERCAALDVPTLIVHGEHDPRPPFAIDDLATALPIVEVEIIGGVSHNPWLERPGAVAALVRRWLAARS
jgi:proline iminopeptidase